MPLNTEWYVPKFEEGQKVRVTQFYNPDYASRYAEVTELQWDDLDICFRYKILFNKYPRDKIWLHEMDLEKV
jgi:hypothetical protein